LRVKDIAHRNKLLKSGKIQIVSALCDMPLTRHEADSFQIDVPFCNNAFVLVVVNGVYRELIKKAQPLRAFCRTFYIVPQGSGFVIVNDLLVLTNATVAQIQKYGKTVASVGASDKAMSDTIESTTKWKGGPGVGVSGGAHALTSPTINVNEDVIQRFMALTHMNRSFATQCLEENGFNIDKAFEVYMGLKAQNAIPSEAFVH
jgi:nuclear RNA export factor